MKSTDKVILKCLPIDEVVQKVQHIMDYEDGIREIFAGRKDRVQSANVISLITLNNKEEVGFLNLVPERIDDVYFIDMGIKAKYRGQGIGKKAIEELINSNRVEGYIIGETKQDNVLSNALANSNMAIEISKCDDIIYYLFGDIKTKERFIKEGKLKDLEFHNKEEQLQKRYIKK